MCRIQGNFPYLCIYFNKVRRTALEYSRLSGTLLTLCSIGMNAAFAPLFTQIRVFAILLPQPDTTEGSF